MYHILLSHISFPHASSDVDPIHSYIFVLLLYIHAQSCILNLIDISHHTSYIASEHNVLLERRMKYIDTCND